MPKTHQRVTWEPVADPNQIVRSSIGGYPVLPVGESWPVCTEDDCNQRMSLFFQFEVEDSFNLPFEAGAILSVFQCINHDDPFEELDTRSPSKLNKRLPDNYWSHSNSALSFVPPGKQQLASQREPFVIYSQLVVASEDDQKPRSVAALNYENIKIGGSPFWVQKPKLWNCSCGAEMDFLCSMPGNLKYPRAKGSPRQPNVYSDGHHFLFLGLSTYVFACRARCHSRAIVAARQN
jgi:hypothetical protein